MRVLVFGGTGLVGQALYAERGGHHVVCVGSADADICDAEQVRTIVEASRPDWVILAAAYTDVDGCETNPERAFAVNTVAATDVAAIARSLGVRLMFLSTDYVFDGESREPYEIDAPKRPLSVYGRSKADAEDQILSIDSDACIVRTARVFGVEGRCFPRAVLAAAERHAPLRIVDDQRGSPTLNHDLAAALLQLAERSARGIVHCTNRGDCTWFEFAQEILRHARIDAPIHPISAEEANRPAPRPAYSVLSDRSLREHGIEMRAWTDALEEYLDRVKRAPASGR